MVTQVNLTGNIADLIGTDFDPRRTKVWVTANVEVIIDATGNAIRLGDTYATVSELGVFTFTGLWATNSATNPTAFQYQLHIDYPKRSSSTGRETWDSGWFDLTATSDIADVAQTQYVPPTWLTTATALLQGYVDDAAASEADAEAAAAAAAASAALADSYIVADLNTSDGQMEALIESPTSLTSAALSATFAPFDVKLSFGAVGDGVTNDTAAVQAAINAAEAAYSAVLDPVGVQPTVLLPSGSYALDGITLSKAVALVGEGPSSTILRLRPGNTGSLITVNVSDVGGTSVEDADHPVIANMQLHGNRVDSVTTGTSHGINCPNAAYSEATQYATAFRGSNLVISNFTGDGIFLGTNRNWMLLDGAIVRYNNTNGVESYSFDHRLTSCDLGVNALAGFRAQAGGAVSFVGVNTYSNQFGVRIDPSATAPFWFVNTSFDLNKREGASITGPGAGTNSAYTFVGCRFAANSTDGANLYSDIKVDAAGSAQVIGCQFLLGAQAVKYLIEHSTVDQVVWAGNAYATSGSTPYATAVTNDFTKLRYAGARDAFVGPYAGLNTLSAVIGAVEVWKATSAALQVNVPFRTESLNPRHWMIDTDAAADAKKWLWNYSGNNLQFLTANDAEGAFGNIFTVNRVGNAPTNLVMGIPLVLKSYTTAGRPSAATAGTGAEIYDTTLSKPVWSNGSVWKDAAGTTV